MARLAHRYNSLGQILAAGGEVSVGLLIARGASQADVISEIQQKYPDLPVNDVAALYDISLGMAQAGVNLTAGNASQLFDLGLIPVNPSLFGDEPDGRRIKLVINAFSQATGKDTLFYTELADSLDLATVFADAADKLQQWVDESPEMLERMGVNVEEAKLHLSILFAERRF